jgi:hypothetical protein
MQLQPYLFFDGRCEEALDRDEMGFLVAPCQGGPE